MRMVAAGEAKRPTVLRFGALLLLWAGVAALYWQTSAALGTLWMDADRAIYTDGFPLAGLALWLVFRNRERLAAARLQPQPSALPLALLCSLAWLVTVRAGVQTAGELILLPILWLAVLATFGPSVARNSALPVFLLGFGIPVWDLLSDSLAAATSGVSAALVRLCGVPVEELGTILRVPAGSFEVASGCSGLNFLVAGLAAAALYGELHEEPLLRRVLLLTLGGLLSLTANWIRVAIIVLIGEITAMRSRLMLHHSALGWLLFVTAIVGFVLIAEHAGGRWVRRWDTRTAAGVNKDGLCNTAQLLNMSILTFLSLAAGPVWAYADGHLAVAQVPHRLLAEGNGEWRGPLADDSGWRPQFPGADTRARAVYRGRDATIQVYIAAYAVQRRGKRFLGYGTSATGGETGASQPATFLKVLGRPVLQRIIGGSQAKALSWQWYAVDGRSFASGWQAELWYGLVSTVRIPPSRTVILRAPCQVTCEAAEVALQEFVQSAPWLFSS